MNTEETTIHQETIKCPECSKVQEATVQHTYPWHSYVHHCEECDYIITESEWNRVKPAIGGVGESPQDRSEAKPETPGPEGYRPDNQVLPQETTTQNIKTAAQHLEEVRIYGRRLSEFLLPDQVKFLESAMHAYAQQLIEADRKDCAEKATTRYVSDYRSAIGCRSIVDQDSILNRPLPKFE